MYPPAAFRLDDIATLQRHLGAHPLALLISQDAAGPQVSHLPLWLAADEGPRGTLYGHLARGNPQLAGLARGDAVLAVFQGPQAYVSPSLYPSKAEQGRMVPTWNYLAVHARGVPEVFDDPGRLRTLLERLTEHHESNRDQPWQLADAPEDYLRNLLGAIRGLRLPIDSLTGIAKLSQNRNPTDREGVRQGLATSADPEARALAALIPPSRGPGTP